LPRYISSPCSVFLVALPGPEATLKQLHRKVKRQAVICLYSKLEINTT
jgi:hypothetical protein